MIMGEMGVYLGGLWTACAVDGAGFDSTGSESLKQSEMTPPSAPVSVREGAVVAVETKR